MRSADDDPRWWEGALALVAEPGGGFVLTRGQARRLGLADSEVRRRLRRGTWTNPRRGVLCPLPARADDRPHAGSPEIEVAAAALGRPGAIASHESAAILHGLPVLRRRRPGVTAAVRVLELADARAESPLESLTRLLMIDAGLPPFEPQGVVATYRGRYRVDFLFRTRRVVVEADGLHKYRGDPDALPPREKLRQEAIERAGYRVVRATWDDVVRQPAETIARIQRALWSSLATV
jgi:very-short-patch-repair endonuclease